MKKINILFIVLLLIILGASKELTAQQIVASPTAVNGWELIPSMNQYGNLTYDKDNTFSRLENGYQTFKSSGTTYDMGGEFDIQTNYRKPFSNIFLGGSKKTPKFFGFNYKISELIGDVAVIQIGLAVLDNYSYVYSISMSERAENPVVDGWKKVRVSTEKIIGKLPIFSQLNFIFWGVSKKIGYISVSISIDNLFGEDSLGIRTTYDSFDITDVPRGNSLPKEFSLSQNYPNPFNPATIIKYSVPRSQFVNLKVYDLLGKEVATLVNEEKPAGEYEVRFDASNLPSGLYIYRLQGQNINLVKKMMLLK